MSQKPSAPVVGAPERRPAGYFGPARRSGNRWGQRRGIAPSGPGRCASQRDL